MFIRGELDKIVIKVVRRQNVVENPCIKMSLSYCKSVEPVE